jgi:NADH-quinone oxidoreductase subunit L
MGGLRKYMPITWITSLLGSLALIGTPLFAGFYSKDSIIEAVHASHLPGAGFAYFAVIAGVFVTAFYSFRMYFLVFHGEERFRHKPFPGEHDHHDDHGDHGHAHEPHESPWVVTAPLVLLAIPSVVIGFLAIGPMLYGDFFKDAIFVNSHAHHAMHELAEEFHGATAMALHAFTTLPFWLALGGVVTAYVFYMLVPSVPATIARSISRADATPSWYAVTASFTMARRGRNLVHSILVCPPPCRTCCSRESRVWWPLRSSPPEYS